MNKEEKLKNLDAIIEAVNMKKLSVSKGVVTIDQLKQFVDLLLKKIDETKGSNNNYILGSEKKILKYIDKSLTGIRKEIDKNSSQDPKTKEDISGIKTNLKEVEQNIKDFKNDSTLELDTLWSSLKNLEKSILPPTEKDSAEEIRNKLETLEEDDRLPAESIKGLEDRLSVIETRIKQSNNNYVSVGARDLFQDIDISSQLDGSTKTFDIPAVWNIISVDLSSFPYGALRKNIDYTYTPTTITFTDEIDATTQLGNGQTCILTVINS